MVRFFSSPASKNSFVACAAPGTGLDGKTKVESLKLGKSDDHPGKTLVQDAHGNNMITTADELFVAAQAAAEQAGFRLTATKIGT